MRVEMKLGVTIWCKSLFLIRNCSAGQEVIALIESGYS
jgi:hypothetical protein